MEELAKAFLEVDCDSISQGGIHLQTMGIGEVYLESTALGGTKLITGGESCDISEKSFNQFTKSLTSNKWKKVRNNFYRLKVERYPTLGVKEAMEKYPNINFIFKNEMDNYSEIINAGDKVIIITKSEYSREDYLYPKKSARK